ncbi:MAG: hypothetical protein IT437_05205 [Phycisphaerales bacterium]|nr:hypothetical protein [Phycisphaerales bacterium]
MTRAMIGVLLTAASVAAAQGTLYGVNIGTNQLVKIDPATLVATVVGPVGTGPLNGLTADPATNTLYALNPGDGGLYRINPATGATSLIASGLFTNNANGLAFDPVGPRLLVSDNNANELHEYNLTTGGSALLSTISGATDIEGLGYNTTSQTLFGLSDGATEAVYKIHAPSGQTSQLAVMPFPGIWRGLDIDSSTGLLYATTVNPNRLVTISTVTGVVTSLGAITGTSGAIQGLAWMPAPCYPDCNGDGALNLADFGCFTTKFALGDPYADCNADTVLNLADFGCFTTKFALGCP